MHEFNSILLNENIYILIKNSLFVPKGLVINTPALIQITTWRRPGDRPLSELMIAIFLTSICVTLSQRVNPSPCVAPRKHLPVNSLLYGKGVWYIKVEESVLLCNLLDSNYMMPIMQYIVYICHFDNVMHSKHTLPSVLHIIQSLKLHFGQWVIPSQW